MSEPSIGHNARQELLSIIERVENLEGQIKGLSDDRRDLYAEAKSKSYNVAALKAVIRMRKEDPEKRAERENDIEAYSFAINNA